MEIVDFKEKYDCFLGEVLNDIDEMLKRRNELRTCLNMTS
jgi:hypothetical protein